MSNTTKINLQSLVDKIKKQLPPDTDEYISHHDGSWNFYTSLSGFGSEGDYFCLYFWETKRGEQSIRICHTTDNITKYLNMIKEIKPTAKVNTEILKYWCKSI